MPNRLPPPQLPPGYAARRSQAAGRRSAPGRRRPADLAGAHVGLGQADHLVEVRLGLADHGESAFCPQQAEIAHGHVEQDSVPRRHCLERAPGHDPAGHLRLVKGIAEVGEQPDAGIGYRTGPHRTGSQAKVGALPIDTAHGSP